MSGKIEARNPVRQDSVTEEWTLTELQKFVKIRDLAARVPKGKRISQTRKANVVKSINNELEQMIEKRDIILMTQNKTNAPLKINENSSVDKIKDFASSFGWENDIGKVTERNKSEKIVEIENKLKSEAWIGVQKAMNPYSQELRINRWQDSRCNGKDKEYQIINKFKLYNYGIIEESQRNITMKVSRYDGDNINNSNRKLESELQDIEKEFNFEFMKNDGQATLYSTKEWKTETKAKKGKKKARSQKQNQNGDTSLLKWEDKFGDTSIDILVTAIDHSDFGNNNSNSSYKNSTNDEIDVSTNNKKKGSKNKKSKNKNKNKNTNNKRKENMRDENGNPIVAQRIIKFRVANMGYSAKKNQSNNDDNNNDNNENGGNKNKRRGSKGIIGKAKDEPPKKRRKVSRRATR